jgi:adenylate cyclase class 2
MSFEVEIKYRVNGHAKLAERLVARGGVPGVEVVYEDAYLYHTAFDLTRANKALRLRRAGDSIRITYKGPKRGGPTKVREEIELPLGEGSEAFESGLRLFKHLGFRQMIVVRKMRRPYRLDHRGRPVEVMLDITEGLGTYAEVEAIAETESELPHAQAAVLDLAASLGLEEIEPRSYRRMAIARMRKGLRRRAG